jgi:nucleoid-associated protein YgaU
MKEFRIWIGPALNRLLVLGLVGGLVVAGLTGCSSSSLKEVEDGGEAVGEDELAAEDTPADEVPEATEQTADSPQADGESELAGAEAVSGDSLEASDSSEQPEVAAATPESRPTDGGSFEEVPLAAGSTLMKIAFDRYGDPFAWRRILEANRDRITDPSRIPAGTILRLEKTGNRGVAAAGDPYLIRTGDTLGRISKTVYGVTQKWKRLWENNRQLIRDPNLIFAGFTLYYTFTDDDRSEFARATGRESGGTRVPASTGQ